MMCLISSGFNGEHLPKTALCARGSPRAAVEVWGRLGPTPAAVFSLRDLSRVKTRSALTYGAQKYYSSPAWTRTQQLSFILLP